MLYLFLSFALLNNIRLRDAFKKENYKGVSVFRFIGILCTGFVLSTLVIYSLFKFQSWPYGSDGLQIALKMLLVVIIVAGIKNIVSKQQFYLNFIVRLFLVGFVSVILLFTPHETLLELKYRDFPDYVKVEKELMKNPENRALQQKVKEERLKMKFNEN